jgi:hypothetical protein
MGSKQRAIKYAEKATAIWENKLPENHPYLINSYRHLSSLYRTLGDKKKANEYAAKASDAAAKAKGKK